MAERVHELTDGKGVPVVYDGVGSGAVKIEENQTYALADAAKAHQHLKGRITTGLTVFLP